MTSHTLRNQFHPILTGHLILNLVAAGGAKTPDESEHSSVKARVDHCREQGSLDAVIDQPKQVAKAPAELDLAKLPAGFRLQVEMKLTDSTPNKLKPVIERMIMSFND